MAKDDEIPRLDTLPPPPSGDAYSAETVQRVVPPELLAEAKRELIRRAAPRPAPHAPAAVSVAKPVAIPAPEGIERLYDEDSADGDDETLMRPFRPEMLRTRVNATPPEEVTTEPAPPPPVPDPPELWSAPTESAVWDVPAPAASAVELVQAGEHTSAAPPEQHEEATSTQAEPNQDAERTSAPGPEARDLARQSWLGAARGDWALLVVIFFGVLLVVVLIGTAALRLVGIHLGP